MHRWLREHVLMLVFLGAAAIVGLTYWQRSWVAANPGLVSVWVTLGLLVVTAWYAATTRRIAEENRQLARETQHLAKETERLAATGSRSLLMQSIPVLAVRRFTPAQMEPDRRTEIAPVFHIQNVGQAAAIVNRVRVELAHADGGSMFLDSQDYGRGELNLGMGHESALAPSGEMAVYVTVSGKGKWDPFSCGCVIEFEDVVGNRFLAKHDIGRTYSLSVKVGDSWQPLDEGFSVDPKSGRISSTGRMENGT